jgi:tripartite-type tricarboxylate transporter receptor subunit TctC
MIQSQFLRVLILLCAVAVLVPAVSFAQPSSSRPIRLLIGFGPGGSTDSLARLYGPKLQELLNAPVIVENRSGASELLAAQPVMNAAPDGTTLWIGTGSALAQGPGVRTDLPYDPVRNFSHVMLMAEVEAILFVRPDVPVRTFSELIGYAKANPGKLNYGSGGVGAGNHLLTEYIISKTGAKMAHVPYKSDAEATREALGGRIDFAMTTPSTSLAFVQEGKLRPLAVTGPERLKALPHVPSVAEAGVAEVESLGSYSFFGLVGPAGMAPDVVQRLNEALNKIAVMPDVVDRMATLYLRPKTGQPAALRERIESERARWRELRKDLNITTW